MSPSEGGSSLSGLILLRKPVGLTSFQALVPIKRALGIGRVGHAGTLDRFASGLLVTLAGPYSRLNEFISAGIKEYRGTIRFGAETSTLDPEGEIVAEGPPPGREALEAVLPHFRGPIMQRPPAYSALHIDGKRAYKRALAGEELEMPARPVVIHALELLDFDGLDANIRVLCSTGTYIRSLARDIALECSSRGHLVALERHAIGPFRLEEAVDPEAFDPARDVRKLSPSEAAALGLGTLRAIGTEAARFSNGTPLRELHLSPWSEAPAADLPASAVFDTEGRLLGVVESRQGALAYRLVLGEGA